MSWATTRDRMEVRAANSGRRSPAGWHRPDGLVPGIAQMVP
ncbi:hypothetical protein [Natronococcus wangiae]|nr:hypothetical protein [Natronococcus sp. AD5]